MLSSGEMLLVRYLYFPPVDRSNKRQPGLGWAGLLLLLCFEVTV